MLRLLGSGALLPRPGGPRAPEPTGIPGTPYGFGDFATRAEEAGDLARLARVVAPGSPPHLTPRGNRRQATCFCAADYAVYRSLLGEGCGGGTGEGWAYGLMPNHGHVIAVPNSEAELRRAIGEAHRR